MSTLTRRTRAAGALLVAGAVLALGACGVEDTTVPNPPPAPGDRRCRPRRPGLREPPAVLRPRRDDPLGIPSGSTMSAVRQRGRLIVGVSADTYLLGLATR